MGSLATKCSDVEFAPGLGSMKELDADTSEEEEEENEDDEDEDDEDDNDEEIRRDAEQALIDGVSQLARGRTTVLKEVIEHGINVGIDADQIMRAEAKLEEHKLTRKREAFDSELRAFIASEDSKQLDACEEMLAQGKQLGLSDKDMQPLRDCITDIRLGRDLEHNERVQARHFMEMYTRRFVSSCLQGREINWLNVESGLKIKAKCYLDVTLKNLRVVASMGAQNTLGAAKLASLTVCRGSKDADVSDSDAFKDLPEAQQELTVVVLGAEQTWCIIESSSRCAEEFLIAFVILNGLNGTAVGLARSAKEAPKKSKGSKFPDKAPVAARKLEEQEDEAEVSQVPSDKKKAKKKKTGEGAADPEEDGAEKDKKKEKKVEKGAKTRK